MQNGKSVRPSLLLISIAFLLWGILRSLDDILIALFQATGSLKYATVMLVHFSFFSAYVLICLPSGIFLQRYGYRNTLTASTLMMSLGTAACVPAGIFHSYPLCLSGIFTAAIGIATLQTSANPCIGLLGPEATATQRLLLVQGVSSFGSVLGPFIGSLLFQATYPPSIENSLPFPGHTLAYIYSTLTVLLLTITLLFRWRFSSFPETSSFRASISMRSLLSHKRLLFGFTAIFLYVGTEATVLGHAVRYLSIPGIGSFQLRVAVMLLSTYWVAVVAGRIIAARLLSLMHTRLLLQASAMTAFLLLQIALLFRGRFGGACLLATGVCNAAIFPSVFALSVTGLSDADLGGASGFLTMGICGGAVIPLLSGWLADHLGISAAFYLPSLSYLIICICSTIYFPKDYHLRPRR